MAKVRINKTMTKLFTSAHRVVYKISKGKIGATQAGAKVAVLTTTGRKSGKDREVPIIVEEDGNGWVVVASYSGHDENPGWYHNLKASPAARLLIGDESHPVVATELDGARRQAGWDKLAAVYPDYNEYQKVTDRQIPVLHLAKT